MRFVCIDDEGVPDITLAYLEAACSSRDVEFLRLQAGAFDYDPEQGLGSGDMLYRPATSARAVQLEQFLAHEGVATFYAEPLGAFFAAHNHPLLFQQLGLQTPRTLPVTTTDREALRALVRRVGGLPVIVKVLGWSRGVGVLRADTLGGLFSIVDLLLAEGRAPFLSAYVPEATHWRVTVIGPRAVAAYRNPAEADDFRTVGGERPEDFLAEPPPELADLALAAARAMRIELAGVDILRHPSGRLYLLEANFPCYFAHAQEFGGVDVAGAMVDHLIAKAMRAAQGA